MKKIIFTILFSLSFSSFFLTQALAQEGIDDKINELKNKVASRVAELNLVEKRGLIGTVDSVSATQITITDLNGRTRLIDVDEFTKFSAEDEAIDLSDIKKGLKISALGLYNKESERLLARFINEIELPKIFHGVVASKDDESFTIDVATEDKTTYIVDIERLTRTFSFAQGPELETSGFSKIKESENIIVSGFLDPDEKNRITASRIVLFPGVEKNPKVTVVEEVIPSTGSGKKLTPLGR